MLVYLFKGTTRQLRQITRPWFYKGLIKEIRKENYVSRLYLEDKKIVKENVKKIYFITDKPEQLKEILNNNDLFFPW